MALVKMIPVLIILSCPLLLSLHLLLLIQRQNCGLTTGQDTAHFVVANAVPEQRQAQVFLTNQTAAVYKQLANLATQQTPSKDINKLTMSEIVNFMKEQFDPKLFIVRERFKFWCDMQRKPGETLQELAAHIRQDAATSVPVIFLLSKTHKTKLCARDSYALSTMKLS